MHRQVPRPPPPSWQQVNIVNMLASQLRLSKPAGAAFKPAAAVRTVRPVCIAALQPLRAASAPREPCFLSPCRRLWRGGCCLWCAPLLWTPRLPLWRSLPPLASRAAWRTCASSEDPCSRCNCVCVMESRGCAAGGRRSTRLASHTQGSASATAAHLPARVCSLRRASNCRDWPAGLRLWRCAM